MVRGSHSPLCSPLKSPAVPHPPHPTPPPAQTGALQLLPRNHTGNWSWVCLSHRILSIQGQRCPLHRSSPSTHPSTQSRGGIPSPRAHMTCPPSTERQGRPPHPSWASWSLWHPQTEGGIPQEVLWPQVQATTGAATPTAQKEPAYRERSRDRCSGRWSK